MLPIRDHNPSAGTPFVTYALIAANVLVFFSYWKLLHDPEALWLFYLHWGMIPSEISQGQGLHGLLTSMFVHGGALHLAGNMLFLWIFGDNLEADMGGLGFALFYFASGIGAALVQVIVAPGSEVPTIGASGAIAGVMGGYLLLYPRARVDVLFFFLVFFKIFAIPAWIVLGVWFGIQLYSGAGADMSVGGVAYWAHVGGFAVGLGMTVPVWLRRGGRAFWTRTEGRPDQPAATYSLSRVPRVPKRNGRPDQ